MASAQQSIVSLITVLVLKVTSDWKANDSVLCAHRMCPAAFHLLLAQ